ncbi:MAG: type I restriction endonuclease subunit R [Spirochaetota bacterium]
MRNFVSENQIEKAAIKLLQEELGYDAIVCKERNTFPDNSGREDKSQVVLKEKLIQQVEKLNPTIPEEAQKRAVAEITKGRQAMSDTLANKEIYNLIREGVPIAYKNAEGKTENERVKIIDWNHPENNNFTVVSQMAIQGTLGYRIPDLLLCINGIPLVFLELKNSNVSVQVAYSDNLSNYRKEIMPLFHYNAICILSNGLETRVGAFNAGYEHFFTWLRVENEKEKVDKKKIGEEKISLEYTIRGLLQKQRLLDYLENFILYHKDTQKIIAKNHQFLGVNNTIESFKDRKSKKGKLGVFWHTQGSGKSFSMIFFTRKVNRKFTGKFTFVIVTDRDDLDRQIYKNFLNTESVTKNETCRPANSKKLREFLTQQKIKYVFTLIQKFRYDKGKKYPILSERDDIIVLQDEGHRTAYETLAENMRKGLPNAGYLAFTGTPLLGKDRKTNAWFGDYVSEYNFSQSIEDGATVPLFYEKRVPEVQIQNDALGDDFAEILEEENLTEEQESLLKKSFAKEIQVIKRDDRLEKIAEDIAKHFPYRGYKGKAIVVSIDKFTAVRMYDKVSHYWKKEQQLLQRKINNSNSETKREELKAALEYMRKVDMAVILSEDAAELEKFKEEGLDILVHRRKLNTLDENGHGIEYRFKDPQDTLQLAFVCAMWLTGFDAPTVSTLYLDKPMKNHTLMQAIARANRVAPGKTNGIVVDYYNVFRSMKKALADYGGENTDGENNTEDSPVQPKENLFALLDTAIKEGYTFCKNLGIDLTEIIAQEETFGKIALFEDFADVIVREEKNKKEFYVYENTISALYEACKPDILETQQERPLMPVFSYLRGVIEGNIDRGNLDSAKRRISQLLDDSVLTEEDTLGRGADKFRIKNRRVLDLSKLDIGKLKEEFKGSPHKNIEIEDLKQFIHDKLEQMLAQNETRIDFYEKYKAIVETYNSGGTATDDYFKDLTDFVENLKQESERHIKEGLTEEELEIFDLLKKAKLTKEEEKSVKNAAKHLLKRLYEEQPKILTPDWHKFTQSQSKVKGAIERVLDEELPDSYNRRDYNHKCNIIYDMVLKREIERAG